MNERQKSKKTYLNPDLSIFYWKQNWKKISKNGKAC